jgi:hypothetical protein
MLTKDQLEYIAMAWRNFHSEDITKSLEHKSFWSFISMGLPIPRPKLPPLNIGDKVMIVRYGKLAWIAPNQGYVDLLPQIIGETGIIRSSSQNEDSYSLAHQSHEDMYTAWYLREQLELVNKNPNIP